MFEAISIKKEVVFEREESLRLSVRGLDDDDKKLFHQKFSEDLRDPDTYAVLNFFFVAGLHHFYLGKNLRGLVNIIVFSVGVVSIFLNLAGLGLTLIIAIVLIELPALFRAQLLVSHHNNELSDRLLQQIKSDNLGSE